MPKSKIGKTVGSKGLDGMVEDDPKYEKGSIFIEFGCEPGSLVSAKGTLALSFCNCVRDNIIDGKIIIPQAF